MIKNLDYIDLEKYLYFLENSKIIIDYKRFGKDFTNFQLFCVKLNNEIMINKRRAK